MIASCETTGARSRHVAHARAGFLCLAVLLAAGCGDHDNNLAQDTNATRPSLRINFDEEEFAAEPELAANPDDVVTLRLENPNGDYADSLDTGDEPGVDVIPYRYFETKEREFCWETDPGAERPPNGAPAYMLLIDEAQEVVLRVEQDGECVRQLIPAGTYRAEFHHGASVNDDRDLLFIVPRASGDSPTVPAAAVPEPSDDTPPAIPPTDPYCPSHALPNYDVLERVLLVRIINDDYGQPCPAPPKKWGYLPFEFFTMPGVCTDVSLIRGRCTYRGEVFLTGIAAGNKMRLYQDLFFRGPRKTVEQTFPLPPGYEQIVDEFVAFSGPASMVVVSGAPAPNGDLLIRTNGCEGCNLAGVSLPGRDLSGAKLKLADLSHASLEGAHLNRIQGVDTIFKSANLVGAEFVGADLTQAHFDSAGAVEGGAAGQVYPAADLTAAKFNGATLTLTDLRGAKLDRADFAKTTLDGADLSGASAVRAVFREATLTKTVSLRGMTITGADFSDAVMNGVTATSAVGRDVLLTRAKMIKANLQGAVLSGARMEGAVLQQAVMGRDLDKGLAACQLSDAYMANVDLSSAEATGVNLRQARFYGRTASAVDAVLTNADMVGAELSGTDFTNASLQNAHLDGATCVNCKFTRAHMAATSVATMDGAKFSGTRIQGADLSQAMLSGCVFTDAILSFETGNYSVGGSGEFQYSAVYGPTKTGELTTQANVICPDGLPGPCNTQQRLLPHGSTPTRIPTRTPPPTWTPGGEDPFATPTPRV